VRAAERLRSAGLPCPVVSAGSTPTAVHARSLEGVTEMRPGNYMFFDLQQVGLGVCSQDDIAVSVLAAVTGHKKSFNRAVIDAGALALSKDLGANETLPEVGYGLVCDSRSGQPLPGVRVASVSQEHGWLEMASKEQAFPFAALPVGQRVRVLPNHSCLTAAMYDRYYVIDGGEQIVAEWPRVSGW
jgi:D-serine deaminase-like pyridoxal phosphate-dependent protein